MSHRARSRLASLALLVAVSTAPARALCDPTPDQRLTATSLFDDARKLMAAKDFVQACPKLEESQRLDPGLGTLLNLAECQAQLGKTATAWANFLEAAYQAKAQNQTKREMAARARAATLEPKLSRLTIKAVLTSGVAIEIKRDGNVVSPSTVGTAIPLDPGVHTISASAPGKQPWSTTITVTTEPRSFEVGIPQLDEATPVPPPDRKPPPPPPPEVPKPAPEVTPPPPLPPPPPPPPDTSNAAGPRAAGIALTLLGAGGLVTGAVFAALAAQKNSASMGSGQCTKGNVCTAAGTSTRNQALTDGDIATGAFIGGGVVAAAGVGCLIAAAVMSKKSTGSAAVPVVSVALDPRGGASLGVSGRF
jgi:serine/threonine-protein kinase